MSKGSTRRGFLKTAGAAAGFGIAPEVAAAQGSPGRRVVEFFGEHQAGISTPSQEHLQFVSLDVFSNARSDLRWLLHRLSGAAARMSRGEPVGALQTGTSPPVDTGEAVGLAPARLTVTFGFGPSLFRRGRFGLASRRPAALVELPSFPGDDLQHRLCGGDIGLQICADDPQVAFHAVHNLIRLASPVASPRWLLAGFGRTITSHHQRTGRNLMGFKDGTANIMAEDRGALNQYVWARPPSSPAWMHGGSYMVVRRIAMSLERWDDSGLDAQEDTFGRRKLSGAPLGGHHEHDPVNLKARVGGKLVIPSDAHVRLANPHSNRGERMLRRGYSYVDGVNPSEKSPAGGLLFICYQRDPRKQFIPIQRRLASRDALNEYTNHVGSAIFACPPGARRSGFVGEALFA